MKVYPDKLSAYLKKNTSPVHIVSGDDPLLVQESVDLIRSAMREKGVGEREVFHVEGNLLPMGGSHKLFSWARASVGTPPLTQ